MPIIEQTVNFCVCLVTTVVARALSGLGKQGAGPGDLGDGWDGVAFDGLKCYFSIREPTKFELQTMEPKELTFPAPYKPESIILARR